MSPLEIWYDRIDLAREIEGAPDKAARKRRERLEEQARRRVAENLFPKLVTTDGGRMRIADQPPLIFHPLELTTELALEFLDAYRDSLSDDRRVLFDRYRFEDAAIKIVGVGSVGTRCFVVLFTSDDGHPLLLQVKEANASVMAPYLAESRKKVHNGKRVVVGQHLMQPASDIFLGWATGPNGRDFYVRQLRDMKLSITLAADRRPVHELRQVLRARTGPRSRQHRLRRRDRRLPRHQQQGRQGVRPVRCGLRRPDRTRPPSPRRGNRQRPDPRHHGNHVGPLARCHSVTNTPVGARLRGFDPTFHPTNASIRGITGHHHPDWRTDKHQVDDTIQHQLDGLTSTHNPWVAGSIPARPTMI